MSKNFTFISREDNKSKIVRYLIIVFLAIILIGGSIISVNQGKDEAQESPQPTATPTVTVTPSPTDNHASSPSAKHTDPPASNSVSKDNAMKSGEIYLDSIPLSKKGLVKQLEFEGYSREDSIWVSENIVVDWDQQAFRMAKFYIESSPFSRRSLINQLELDGFTHDEAVYGTSMVGL